LAGRADHVGTVDRLPIRADPRLGRDKPSGRRRHVGTGKVGGRTDDAGVLGGHGRRLRRLPGALVGGGPTPSTLGGRTWQWLAT
jgi:hypothetical protein